MTGLRRLHISSKVRGVSSGIPSSWLRELDVKVLLMKKISLIRSGRMVAQLQTEIMLTAPEQFCT